MFGAAVQHIPPICVRFEAENIPPTGFPFLDNAGAGTRTAAMDKMKRVRSRMHIVGNLILNKLTALITTNNIILFYIS